MSVPFELQFIGKSSARHQADTPPSAVTVRQADTISQIQCDSQQTVFDLRDNHFIAGDNLEVLKNLQTVYTEQIDTIYIDPPYNSGNRFVYADRFTRKQETPPATVAHPFAAHLRWSGRQHSDWLAMMYPRLILARRLLRSSGVIFVSIDERELAHLKILMDEIFGEQNFIDLFSWAKTETPANLSRKSKKIVEYILCYQKKRDSTKFEGIQKKSKSTNGLLNQTNRLQTLVFPKGIVQTKLPDGIIKAGRYGTSRYDIELLADATVKSGVFTSTVPLRAKFKWTMPKLELEIAKGTALFIIGKTLSPSYEKSKYAAEVPPNFINSKVGVATNEVASKQLTTLLGAKVFDYPKPVSLLKYLLAFQNKKDAICLDFFAGSGTLAQAVWEMNRADAGNRKWICVQETAPTPTDSIAAQHGFENIADIAHERIKRVQTEQETFVCWKMKNID